MRFQASTTLKETSTLRSTLGRGCRQREIRNRSMVSDETGRTLDESLELVEDIRYDQVENCARAVGKLFTKKKGWKKLEEAIQAENALDELIYAIRTEALKNNNNNI